MYLWITISHHFVYLPNLQLTILEQQVCSAKIDYTHAVTTLISAHQAKKQCNFDHGTILRTGITCKETPCSMSNSVVWENVKSLLVYLNKLFWIAQPYFSTHIIKWSYCQLFFLLLRLLMKKSRVSYSVTVINIITLNKLYFKALYFT